MPIPNLPFRLELAEVRYSQRESRPEDLDAIRELKKLVSQQEFMLKEAVVSYITSDTAAQVWVEEAEAEYSGTSL